MAKKQLARAADIQREGFVRLMKEINAIARRARLKEYDTYSRIWEYPWLWSQLKDLPAASPSVLDVGSEMSPFPWFLAMKGYRVIVSDTGLKYWDQWEEARECLGVSVTKRVVDASDIAMPTASIDIYLSVSVLEHVADKAKAISEAARILRPGGHLIMTLDICEESLGMTFPEWNGRALSMKEFDSLFSSSSWFESGVGDIDWNTEDIEDYLAWHRTTAPHHNYVTGAAVIRRNSEVWAESPHRAMIRRLRSAKEHIYWNAIGWARRQVRAAVKSATA